jgi:hypothetical protein
MKILIRHEEAIYKIFITLIIIIFSLKCSTAFSASIYTCSPYQQINIGKYVVQTNYWNKSACPGTQCMRINSQTGSFSVLQSTALCPNVSSYPSIVYGKAWSVCSHQNELPAPIDSLKTIASNWNFMPTNSGSWDAAYDIWIGPNEHCGSRGFNGGAEIMIWLDYRHASGWQYDLGAVTICGHTWEVWKWNVKWGQRHWHYIAYLSKTPITAVHNLWIQDFLKDAISRNLVKNDWYLYAIEAGIELRQKGVPFTSKKFSVHFNRASTLKTVYTITHASK